jgi:folate-dependent phosphoribosylglycinamide formyltransferase PurN
MKSILNDKKIIILATEGESTNILYNSLKDIFNINYVIIEERVEAIKFIKQRFKRVGFLRLIDQILFFLILNKILISTSKKRRSEILQENDLNENNIDKEKITRVNSANSIESINLIKNLAPDIVIVNGTRILSKKILTSTNTIFINIHAGITPNYRGVHGAYWAYVKNQPNLAGVSLHYVDTGVDTGKIIGQALIKSTAFDNFSTYPLLQLSEGIIVIKQFLNNLITNCTTNFSIISINSNSNSNSKQWYHPGFFEYLYYRIIYKVK